MWLISVAAPMLVTKALLQDVMVLAFVPLLLISKESPAGTKVNQYKLHVLTNVIEQNKIPTRFLSLI
ncbi:hypothetical protein [Lysinibacillus sp. NPDC056232]|uniref:hypothetical protein n=1 Tax=Lysinibacillus sp. NPDC056232 TaxID=3345756 RepID=UPI0035E188D0